MCIFFFSFSLLYSSVIVFFFYSYNVVYTFEQVYHSIHSFIYSFNNLESDAWVYTNIQSWYRLVFIFVIIFFSFLFNFLVILCYCTIIHCQISFTVQKHVVVKLFMPKGSIQQTIDQFVNLLFLFVWMFCKFGIYFIAFR